MLYFKGLIESRLDNLKSKRYSSIQAYIDYIALLAHTGHLNIIHDLFFKEDILFIQKNKKEFLDQATYGHIIGLFERIKSEKYPKIIQDILQNTTYVLDKEVTDACLKFYKQLSPETSTHEQNFVLNFLLNELYKRNVFFLDKSPEIVNYFFKAKNCNLYRKEFCIFSLLEYCQISKYEKMFMLKDKYYDHMQSIFYHISTSILLSNSEKKVFTLNFYENIKKVNSLKRNSKKPKIAVCISGLYRNHVQSLESIRENVILPTDADVFIHSWDERSIWLGFGGSPFFRRVFGKQPEKVTLPEINDLRHLKNYLPTTAAVLAKPVYKPFDGQMFKLVFAPKKMEIENQAEFESTLKNTAGYALLRGSLNQIKMFHGLKRSIDMALEYDNYDYIIRLRPDMIIEKKIDLSSLEKLETNHFYTTCHKIGVDDAEFIASSSVAHSLSQLISQMFEFEKLSPYSAFPLYDSHNLFLLWLIENEYFVDHDLMSRRILTSYDTKNEVPYLKEAIDKDFSELSEEDQEKFKLFVNFLKKDYC